ncbi:hypothetical protein ACLIIZ_06940 [Azonexus caeni]|jgi:hypothetical protein|uniref:hypothetical protein n=1 Tax=Azonexus caeni TaxID=266126 RepID=UPI003A88AF34
MITVEESRSGSRHAGVPGGAASGDIDRRWCEEEEFIPTAWLMTMDLPGKACFSGGCECLFTRRRKVARRRRGFLLAWRGTMRSMPPVIATIFQTLAQQQFFSWVKIEMRGEVS